MTTTRAANDKHRLPFSFQRYGAALESSSARPRLASFYTGLAGIPLDTKRSKGEQFPVTAMQQRKTCRLLLLLRLFVAGWFPHPEHRMEVLPSAAVPVSMDGRVAGWTTCLSSGCGAA